MPHLPSVKVLSFSYNQLANENQTLHEIASSCPNLEHINLMKNPCNPVFKNDLAYRQFRARFSIWIPSLVTLDGVDFKEDSSLIMKMKHTEQAKMVKAQG